MQEIISKRNWDSKLFDTGRIDDKERPIYGTKIQNGLHDIEPDGSFVECNTLLKPCSDGVSTDMASRTRCGEVRISDTGSESKQLAKVKTKELEGISAKLKGHRTYGPMLPTLKEAVYSTYDGITVRQYPNYKGINIILEIANPQTASNVYQFTIKEYGCEYVYEEIDGNIKCISSSGKSDMWIKALYAIDANDNYGSVSMRLGGQTAEGYQIVEKVINPVWLGNAVGPVKVDPSVTIDDDTGTFEDTIIYDGQPTYNYGIFNSNNVINQAANKQKTFHKVDLTTLSNVTVTDAYMGLDVYGSAFPLEVSAHVLLVDWGQGTKNGSLADTGECTYNDSEKPTAWNTAGCNGDGTDRVALADGTLNITGIGSDTHFPLSNAAVEAMIDSPSTNFGWVFESDTEIAVKGITWRSNNSVSGNKPYIYIEYTEGAAQNLAVGFSIYDDHFNVFREIGNKHTIV